MKQWQHDLISLAGQLLAQRPRAPQAAPRSRPSEDWLAKNTILIGGQRVPLRLSEFAMVYSGGMGTGKTTAFTAQMTSHIDALIASKRPFNVHSFTTKPDDFYPLLKARYEPLGISVRTTNPFIAESWAWDGAGDLTNLPRMDELSAVVIKDDRRDSSPFFKKTAQLVFRGVVQSLASTHMGLWTMRHVVLVLRDVGLCITVLGRCEQTRHLVSLLSSEQGVTAANIHATLLAELKGLELVASLIDSTPEDRRFSTAGAANTPGVIWVWGSDPRYNTTIEPWNAVQLELIGHELLIRGKIGVETLLYLDEFPQLSAGGGQKMTIIRKVLEFGRSSDVRSCLAMQTPAQVEAVFGPKDAETLLGQCHIIVAFRHNDGPGQAYFSRRLGKERGFEKKRGSSRQVGGSSGPNGNSSWSVTHSVNIERFDLERVTQSDIGDLPVGTYEFGMFGFASLPLSRLIDPVSGFPEPIRWRFWLSPEFIARHVHKPGEFVSYARSLKPEAEYALAALESWERDFLGLGVKPSDDSRVATKQE